MSWQAYVDERLVGTQQVDKAAIFDVSGQSCWATSAGFAPKPEELQSIVTAFNDPGDANGIKQVQSTGFHVAGDRYVALRSDDRSLYGKKGQEGVVIVKTKQALLVSHYPEGVQPGNAANTVEKLADYLLSVGY